MSANLFTTMLPGDKLLPRPAIMGAKEASSLLTKI